jgi:tRNA(Ile)-lysidine synthase
MSPALPEAARALAAELLERCALAPEGPLEVACSGGPDSSALACLAASTGRPVVLHHVDHGLRPGSASEAVVVKALAERLGAAFVPHLVDVAPGPNLEARARRARLGALPPSAATGHTMDDQAETVLLNLLRGAGADGLGAMVPGARHPVLGLRRAELAALCEAAQLEVVRDPMNEDPGLLRNVVRSTLLPQLADAAGRDLVPVLARTADVLRAESGFLDELASGSVPDPAEVASLRAAPEVLARRALRAWLAEHEPESHPPSAAELDRVLDVVAGRAVATELAGGRRVARTAGRLRIERPGLG